MEGTCEFQEVVSQKVGTMIIDHHGQHLSETGEKAGEMDFLGLLQMNRCRSGIKGSIQSSENGTDAYR